MARSRRAGSINAIAGHKAEDYLWGVPQSPEFSAVQRLLHELLVYENKEGHWLSL